MLAVAAVPFALLVERMLTELGPEGPRLGDLLGGSSGVVVVPLAVFPALFPIAGLLDRTAPTGV
ncbi:MAG TPA: hypothetical protein VFN43_11295 [Humibacillus sp.]|nr:hypothetical protein [Humibacillus sp.]